MAQTIRVLIIEDVPEVALYMRTSLAAAQGIELIDVVPDGTTALETIPAVLPDVVVVDALLRGITRPIQILAAIRERGIPGVVVTVPQTKVPHDPERGIHAVITMPFLSADLQAAIRTAHEEVTRAVTVGVGRFVAVYGPKGGVGRTTISLGLSAALVGLGHRTVLVDGNFQFGDLRALTRLPGAGSILDLPTSEIDEDELGRVLERHAAGFELLLAPPRIEQAEMISVRDVQKVIPALRRHATAIVIDLPVALNETTLAFLDAVETVLVLTTDERASVANTAAVVETFRTLGYPADKVRTVLNRAESDSPAPGLLAALGGEVAHSISADPALFRRAATEGAPITTLDPGAKASRELAAIATEVVGPNAARPSAG
ncbi:MAG: hypothetical protein RL338_788 [Chloroflexota bacterium]